MQIKYELDSKMKGISLFFYHSFDNFTMILLDRAL